MPTSRTLLITAAVAATALTPAAAIAAKTDATPQLRSAPQMRIVDAHHAKLNFASQRLPRTKSGKIDAKITFASGARVSGLKTDGLHGYDTKYVATVSSTSVMHDGDKFAVTFRLGRSKPVVRMVKLYRPGAHY